jgi:hypothetical protein
MDPFWRAMLATLAVLVAAGGACGAAACSSSSSEGRLDAAADMTPAADVNPDAAADACEASSPPGCAGVGSVRACTWAQAEQGACEVAADAGGTDFRCWESSCAGGINLLTCTLFDSTVSYYYDPSGAFFAQAGGTNGGPITYFGPCTFNPEAVACNLIVDAGCASGDGQAPDSGSPESSAD